MSPVTAGTAPREEPSTLSNGASTWHPGQSAVTEGLATRQTGTPRAATVRGERAYFKRATVNQDGDSSYTGISRLTAVSQMPT